MVDRREPGSPDHAGDEPVEQLADEVAEETTDEETRRETLELDLMEEGRSDAGGDVELEGRDREPSG